MTNDPAPPPPPAARLDVRRVTVGSANPGKIAAVRAALAPIWPDAAIAGVATDSGVRAQPLDDREGALGAVRRAVAAQAAQDADLGVGLEGSVDARPWGMYTLAWVAVVDRAGRVGLASTGRCPLPAPVAAAIRAGAELGAAGGRTAGRGEHQAARRGQRGLHGGPRRAGGVAGGRGGLRVRAVSHARATSARRRWAQAALLAMLGAAPDR